MDSLTLDTIRDAMPFWLKNRYVLAILITMAAIAVSVIVDFFITRVLRVAARRTHTVLDDRLIDLLHGPVRITVVLFGLWLAAGGLGLPPRMETFTAAFVKTLGMFVWMGFAFRMVSVVIQTLSRSGSTLVQTRTGPLFDNLAKVIIIGVAVYFVFVFWGINVSAWLASAGIVGIAVGFAAKDTLANLFSGIFILADAPYQVGDYINLDTGERGEVRHIGLRSTRLLTRDDVEITIPNAVIANAKIINESGGPDLKERIRVKFSVAYGSDVDRVREVITEIGNKHPQTVNDPEPRVRFREFGESSLDFELLCWIEEPSLRGLVTDALLTAIYKGLNAENIEIPYPKRDVYIREMPGTTGGKTTL